MIALATQDAVAPHHIDPTGPKQQNWPALFTERVFCKEFCLRWIDNKGKNQLLIFHPCGELLKVQNYSKSVLSSGFEAKELKYFEFLAVSVNMFTNVPDFVRFHTLRPAGPC